MNAASEPVICRPWSRDDFMRRLVTFKSSTWFAKPKAVNAVNCARRGWVNVGIDTIVCESCGSRLFFSTPASWSLNQVEKAALVFSLKLDTGHKLLCLWTDNICDEVIAQFSPVLGPVLVDGYRKRAIKLSRLSSLPIISTAAVDYLRCPELDQVLAKSVTEKCGKSLHGSLSTKDFHIEEERDGRCLYNEALILISLCGWGIRRLSHTVGCDGDQNEFKDSSILDICSTSFTKEDQSYSKEFTDFSGIQYDPNFVALCCDLCGATILPRVFYTVPHPAELLKFVGCLETCGGQTFKNSVADNGEILQAHLLNRIELNDVNKIAIEPAINNVVVSNGGLSKSGMSIAGGLPPSEQNFKVKISLPLICRKLGLRFLSRSESRHGIDGGMNQISSDGSFSHVNDLRQEPGTLVESDLEKDKIQQPIDFNFEPDNVGGNKDELHMHETCKKVDICARNTDIRCRETDIFRRETDTECSDENAKPLGTTIKLVHDVHSITGTSNLDTIDKSCISSISNLFDVDKLKNIPFVSAAPDDATKHLIISDEENNEMPSVVVNHQYSSNTDYSESNNMDSQEGIKSSDLNYSFHSWLTSTNGKSLNQLLSDKSMKFDPVKQHKYFCAWVAETNGVAPGWKQTLSALNTSDYCTSLSNYSTDKHSIIQMDDPITSIRNLFCSPPTKKRKP